MKYTGPQQVPVLRGKRVGVSSRRTHKGPSLKSDVAERVEWSSSLSVAQVDSSMSPTGPGSARGGPGAEIEPVVGSDRRAEREAGSAMRVSFANPLSLTGLVPAKAAGALLYTLVGLVLCCCWIGKLPTGGEVACVCGMSSGDGITVPTASVGALPALDSA
jgi:hypothetical protein